jgi:Ca2+-binding RTX toxin-like protein
LVDYSQAELPADVAQKHGGLTIDLDTGRAYLANETKQDLLTKIQHAIGTAYNDKFTGNHEDNHFYGLGGTNRYDGKGGRNYFYGGKDQDIYVGGEGGGYDTITDAGGMQDVYRLNMIIDRNRSFIEKDGNDVVMRFNDNSKTVKILGQFDSDSYRGVEYLQFMDGSTYKMSELLGSVSNNHSFNSLGFDWDNKKVANPIPAGWA